MHNGGGGRMEGGTAAVTGVRGVIGSRLVGLLVGSGWKVRGLVRSESDCSGLPAVEAVYGDLTRESDLKQLVAGADAVFNCAGELHDRSRMDAVNSEAPGMLARVSREAGAGFFCHISSAGVVGPVSDAWIDEATVCRPESCYERSKWRGEEALQQVESEGMRICMLRPTNVIGTSSPGILRSAADSGFRSRLSLMLKGGECAHLVHAADVAAAALFMCRNEACDGVYFVGYDEDERNTVAGVINLARSYTGEHPYTGPVLPVAVPYFLRRIWHGRSLYGGSRFSSARLIEAGYRFRYGLDEAVRMVCTDEAGAEA